MNIEGYESIDKVLSRGSSALSVHEFENTVKTKNAIIIDTRAASIFSKGFIPGSINIGIDGGFAVWVGTLIPNIKQAIVFIADEGREEEVITRLARVGYDNTIGYLKGGIDAWEAANKTLDTINNITVDDFATIESENPNIKIVDVRKESEYDSEHIVNAINAPLDYIDESSKQLEKDETYYVHCAGGYRSMTFASILRSRGYTNLINVDGGFSAIKRSGKFNVTEYVCPTTML